MFRVLFGCGRLMRLVGLGAVVVLAAACGDDGGAGEETAEEPVTTTTTAPYAGVEGEWVATVTYEAWEPESVAVDLEPRVRSVTLRLGECPTGVEVEYKPGAEVTGTDEVVGDSSGGTCVGSADVERSMAFFRGLPLVDIGGGRLQIAFDELLYCDTSSDPNGEAPLRQPTRWTIDTGDAPDRLSGEITSEVTETDPALCVVEQGSLRSTVESVEAVRA